MRLSSNNVIRFCELTLPKSFYKEANFALMGTEAKGHQGEKGGQVDSAWGLICSKALHFKWHKHRKWSTLQTSMQEIVDQEIECSQSPMTENRKRAVSLLYMPSIMVFSSFASSFTTCGGVWEAAVYSCSLFWRNKGCCVFHGRICELLWQDLLHRTHTHTHTHTGSPATSPNYYPLQFNSDQQNKEGPAGWKIHKHTRYLSCQ